MDARSAKGFRRPASPGTKGRSAAARSSRCWWTANRRTRRATPQEAALVLAETPFYAEAGGQMADRGMIGNRDRDFPGARYPAPRPRPYRPLREDDRGSSARGDGGRAGGRTRSADGRLCATTAPPICCTAPSRIFWASRCTSRAVSSRRTGYGSISTCRAPMTTEELREIDRRVNGGAGQPARPDRDHCRTARRSRPARWPCSARSTANRSAS